MARLSTHVLDTARGKPAAGMQIRLYRGSELLVKAETNPEGRLVAGDNIPAGKYELVFAVGAYFRAAGETLPDPPFLDDVAVRFGIADTSANYHVPLLVSPYGYSTYRGS
jgi:5-hydroxyisourate hydrolase